MVDAAFLAAMPDGALLVNAARGVVVDTDALLAELTARPAAGGAGRHRPRAAARRATRCGRRPACCSPRTSGGAVPDTNARAAAAVTDQLARVLAGEPLVRTSSTATERRPAGRDARSGRRRARRGGAGRGPASPAAVHLGAARW